MLSKYGNHARLLKIKNKLRIGCFTNKVAKNSRYFVGIFNKTIIPLALMIWDAPHWLSTTSYPTRSHGIIKYVHNNVYFTSNILIKKQRPPFLSE